MTRIVGLLLLLPLAGFAQPELEIQRLAPPRYLEFSPDGSRLWYKLGAQWWEISVAPNSTAKHATHKAPPPGPTAAESMIATHRSPDEVSPDGKYIAYLGAERPYGQTLLFVGTRESGAAAKPISRMTVSDFHWAADSNSLWVIACDGADQPVGRLQRDGHFVPVTKQPAMRRNSDGFAVFNDMLAWVESDGKHLGTIWIRDRSGNIRVLVEPNPQAAGLNPGTQEVIRWKNAHGEELQGILAKPAEGDHFPLIVDPYSVLPNRYFNLAFLGNYLFVREGFAVFFPDHRAPHGFPENSLGEAYVGASKDRDPIDVLADDVMSGVHDLIRRGIADPARMYLYSTSTGATAIAQLLTQTRIFRAAVAHGGVYDWIAHYEMRHAVGDDTVSGFLHGRTPADSADLYRRISPFYHVDQIKTPLLLVLGDKDETRVEDTQYFYGALIKAGSPAKLVIYPGEGHQLSNAALGVKHVRQAIDFFRSAPAVER